MSDEFGDPEGATPLDHDDRQGLIPTWVATRRDLNEVERANILEAMTRLRRRRPKDCLSEDFVIDLHRRMFGDVWRWAGTFRRREVSIGVDPIEITPRLRSLIGDARYWIENRTYDPDEIAVRLHHRMVWIHPFPNGNGRHRRMIADLLAEQLGAAPFSWGGRDLAEASTVRKKYLDALHKADAHNLAPLLAFARS